MLYCKILFNILRMLAQITHNKYYSAKCSLTLTFPHLILTSFYIHTAFILSLVIMINCGQFTPNNNKNITKDMVDTITILAAAT